MNRIVIKCKSDTRTCPEVLCTTFKSISKIMNEINNKIPLLDDERMIEKRCGGITITLIIDDKHIQIYLGIPESLNKEVTIIKEEGDYYYSDGFVK